MKKLVAFISGLGAWWFMGTSVFAMCIWFAPPGRIFEPANSIRTLIVEDNGKQQLIVQPQWTGDVNDFGLVMPFPNKPDIQEAPSAIFDDLENLTNPEITFGPEAIFLDDGNLDRAATTSVEVIEQRVVGDFETTTLTATDGADLQTWLTDNGYELPEAKQKILDFYIDGGSEYFVALKISADVASEASNGFVEGELDPLLFSFIDEKVSLPLRLMAGAEGRVDLIIYTLSDRQFYIPGAELQFARKITASDFETAPSLREFDGRGQWLVRNQIQFNPGRVQIDTVLAVASEDVIVENGITMRINPDQLDPDTGLIESSSGMIVYQDPVENSSVNTNNNSTDSNDSILLVALVVFLGLSNLLLLNRALKKPKKQTTDGL